MDYIHHLSKTVPYPSGQKYDCVKACTIKLGHQSDFLFRIKVGLENQNSSQVLLGMTLELPQVLIFYQ